ncbi:hypothetical protein HPB51_022562 [Rhipicephalus microplus]|uniref:Uncharacterized protein n=1 Tax=Rhipicephalus microplus TaxID=6941 RepID=A0A9J6DCE2_RHIMP|nr:hypothetical protein HPB51_022562 [Rhipicephalus microplus]
MRPRFLSDCCTRNAAGSDSQWAAKMWAQSRRMPGEDVEFPVTFSEIERQDMCKTTLLLAREWTGDLRLSCERRRQVDAKSGAQARKGLRFSQPESKTDSEKNGNIHHSYSTSAAAEIRSRNLRVSSREPLDHHGGAKTTSKTIEIPYRCGRVAEKFRHDENNGGALYLTKEHHLKTTMKMKLGSALKMCATIGSLLEVS